MIPILYETTENSFTTNGIGRLSDAISCVVTEERNGPYELEMQYPITGQYFSELTHSRIIYAVPADGKDGQPFRIYRIEKPLDGICTIYAEHISYELAHIPVKPFTAGSCSAALLALVNNAGQDCPFTVWTNKEVVSSFTLREPKTFRELLGGTQGSILDVYGKGEYEFDKYLVRLYVNRGTDSGVTIRYAKNLVDLVNDENIEDTYTGVCPYWADESGALVMLPEVAMWSATAANYPYKRTKIVDFSDEWETAPTVAQLRARTQTYIEANNIGIPKTNIDVEFVPLWQTEGATLGSPHFDLVIPSTVNGDTLENVAGRVEGDTVYLDNAYWQVTFEDYKILERIHLCDTVTVVYDALGVSHKAEVIKTVYNVLKDRYDSIEVGDAKTTLASIVTGLDSDIAAAEAAASGSDVAEKLMEYVDHQTELISGGLGGYVVLNPNANGEPQEILIMDSDDIATAVNVIRMNKNGIGFSKTGYEGPYTSAWTIDGTLNTDFIGAGTITGAQIAAGSITAGNLSLYGKMGVYTDSTLTTNGGYIGYMAGATPAGTTNGIAIMDSNSLNYVMATTAGVKMRNGSATTPGECNISDGVMEFVGRSAYFQGDTYLNAVSSGGGIGYSGTTYANVLEAMDEVSIVYGTSKAVRLFKASDGGGQIALYNSSAAPVFQVYPTTYGGAMTLGAINGSTVVSLYASQYGGVLALSNASGNVRVNMFVDQSSGGCLTLTDPSGNYATLTRALIQKLSDL